MYKFGNACGHLGDFRFATVTVPPPFSRRAEVPLGSASRGKGKEEQISLRVIRHAE